MEKKENKEKFSPPEPSTGDAAYLVAKAVLSPLMGATELLERFISPPFQRRQREWMENIATALRTLEENKGIKIEELRTNDLFITVVTQASRIAIGNHQKEKLEALKNIVINSASSKENEDIQIVFIRFIDELTPSHIFLLKFFIDEEARLEKIKSYAEIYELLGSKKTNIASQDEIRMFIGDLSARGLIRISQDIDEDKDIYQASSLLLEDTNDNLPRIIISDVAKRFIRFISAL